MVVTGILREKVSRKASPSGGIKFNKKKASELIVQPILPFVFVPNASSILGIVPIIYYLQNFAEFCFLITLYQLTEPKIHIKLSVPLYLPHSRTLASLQATFLGFI